MQHNNSVVLSLEVVAQRLFAASLKDDVMVSGTLLIKKQSLKENEVKKEMMHSLAIISVSVEFRYPVGSFLPQNDIFTVISYLTRVLLSEPAVVLLLRTKKLLAEKDINI